MLESWHIHPVSFKHYQRFAADYSDTHLAANQCCRIIRSIVAVWEVTFLGNYNNESLRASYRLPARCSSLGTQKKPRRFSVLAGSSAVSTYAATEPWWRGACASLCVFP